MKIRFGLFLGAGCLGLSITAASAVDMNLDSLGAYGWSTVITVDSSGRGGIFQKSGPYGGEPVGQNMFMFTEGSSTRATKPWSAITTPNYNGLLLSDITALDIKTSGFEGDNASNFQPPHFTISFLNAGGNTRCAEWLPWTDGIPRTPGNSGAANFGTYNALVDGSWYCAWIGGTYNTWADMLTALGGGCYIVPSNAYGTAWRGNGFSVGYSDYDSSVDKYNSGGRGLVEWFDIGIDGTTTTFYLVPEPGSLALLALGGALVLLRRKGAI
jgi:PEP-CTERM motif